MKKSVTRADANLAGERRNENDKYVVEILDEQEFAKINFGKLRDFVAGVLSKFKLPAGSEVAINFVDLKTIEELNRKFLNKSGPTDVLSFPIEDPSFYFSRFPYGSSSPNQAIDEGSPNLLLGDVVICLEQAKINSDKNKVSFGFEVAFLLSHGLLHLLGFDHSTKEEQEEMVKIQEEILADKIYFDIVEL